MKTKYLVEIEAKCQLCDAKGVKLTIHHLNDKLNNKVMLCRACHNKVHGMEAKKKSTNKLEVHPWRVKSIEPWLGRW